MTTKPQSSWLITINNPTTEERDLLVLLGVAGLDRHDDIKYIKYALEAGEGETPHVQAYIYLHNPQRFSFLQKRLKRAAIFPTIGTPQQCVDYIGNPDFVHAETTTDEEKRGKRKGGTSEPPVTWGNLDGVKMDKGTRPPRKKRDKVLLEIKEKIDGGSTEADLWQDYFPVMVIHSERILKYFALRGLSTENDKLTAKYEENRKEKAKLAEIRLELEQLLLNQTMQNTLKRIETTGQPG